MRREYKGAAAASQLAVELGGSTADTTIYCVDLTNWPTGVSSRPFYVCIDRGTASEEKILCISRSGNVLTVFNDGVTNGRAADGTAITTHTINSTIEHVFTATDANEANAHVNATSDVHGVAGPIAGTTAVQTFTNKTISGLSNNISDLYESDVAGLVDDLAAINTALGLKANLAGGATFTGDVVLPATTSIGSVSATEVGYLDGVTSALQAQLNAKAPLASPTFTGSVVLPSSTSVGNVSSTELGYLDGASSNIQSQINSFVVAAKIPPGGLKGEVLVKLSDTDYDTGWVTVTNGGGGGGAGDDIAVAPYPTGGTITTWTDPGSGAEYRIHTFSGSAATQSLTVTNGVVGSLMLVAGGGGGGLYSGAYGEGAGGGAGGLYTGQYAYGIGVHNMVVGMGGAAQPSGSQHSGDGDDTWFDSLTVFGGGGGGGASQVDGHNGGSGGGAYYDRTTGSPTTIGTKGLGTPGQGSNGVRSGGGWSGNGNGSGLISSFIGSSVTYATGGRALGSFSTAASPVDGTGNGGDGTGNYSTPPARGSHGTVIVKYRIA